MSSEDFSVYLEKVPKGAFTRVGITKAEANLLVLHNIIIDFNDDPILVGVSLFTQYVLDQNN